MCEKTIWYEEVEEEEQEEKLYKIHMINELLEPDPRYE